MHIDADDGASRVCDSLRSIHRHRQAHDHADVEHGNCGHAARVVHLGEDSEVFRYVGVRDAGVERAIQNIILRGNEEQRSPSALGGQSAANDLRHRNDCPSEARLVPEVSALEAALLLLQQAAC